MSTPCDVARLRHCYPSEWSTESVTHTHTPSLLFLSSQLKERLASVIAIPAANQRLVGLPDGVSDNVRLEDVDVGEEEEEEGEEMGCYAVLCAGFLSSDSTQGG